MDQSGALRESRLDQEYAEEKVLEVVGEYLLLVERLQAPGSVLVEPLGSVLKFLVRDFKVAPCEVYFIPYSSLLSLGLSD